MNPEKPQPLRAWEALFLEQAHGVREDELRPTARHAYQVPARSVPLGDVDAMLQDFAAQRDALPGNRECGDEMTILRSAAVEVAASQLLLRVTPGTRGAATDASESEFFAFMLAAGARRTADAVRPGGAATPGAAFRCLLTRELVARIDRHLKQERKRKGRLPRVVSLFPERLDSMRWELPTLALTMWALWHKQRATR